MNKNMIYAGIVMLALSGCSKNADTVSDETSAPAALEEIKDVQYADLLYRAAKDRTVRYCERLYQPEELSGLESLLRSDRHNGDSSSPFNEFYLNLYQADGTVKELALASDGCYEFFPHAPINSPGFTADREEQNESSAAGQPEFTQEELQDAMDCVEKKFEDFQGCDMLRMWYDPENSARLVRGYLEYGNGSGSGAKATDVLYLFSDFVADPEKTTEMSLLLGSPYDDFSWTLVRADKTSPWKVDSWGY